MKVLQTFFFLLFEREKFKSSNVKAKPSGNNMLLLSSLNHTTIQLITLVYSTNSTVKNLFPDSQ